MNRRDVLTLSGALILAGSLPALPVLAEPVIAEPRDLYRFDIRRHAEPPSTPPRDFQQSRHYLYDTASNKLAWAATLYTGEDAGADWYRAEVYRGDAIFHFHRHGLTGPHAETGQPGPTPLASIDLNRFHLPDSPDLRQIQIVQGRLYTVADRYVLAYQVWLDENTNRPSDEKWTVVVGYPVIEVFRA